MSGSLRLTSSRYFRRQQSTSLASNVPRPSLQNYSPEQVQFASRAWTMRGEQEHHSAAIFSDLQSFLIDVDIPLDVLSQINRIVGDELRHAELCAEIAGLMGATPPHSRSLSRGALPSTSAERRARGLHIVLVEGAIGETISASLFNAGRRVAEEPCTKTALTLIHQDEALHARSFWEMLTLLKSEFDETDRERLHRQAQRALGSLEQEQILPSLQRLERGEFFDPTWSALGVLPPEQRAEAFYWAIEKRVIPQLNAVGLDGALAWRNRYRD
jgi:hypothetical protein